MKSEEMLCPLRFNSGDLIDKCICLKARCAWWDWESDENLEKGQCGILAIALNLDVFRCNGLPVNNSY